MDTQNTIIEQERSGTVSRNNSVFLFEVWICLGFESLNIQP